MKLKLQDLRAIAKQTMQESQVITALRREIREAFGPRMRIDGSIIELSTRVNERLETLERTGAPCDVKMSTSMLVKLAKHKSPVVRQVAARLLPERIAVKLAGDRDPGVREQVAKRAPVGTLVEMCKRFPKDDQLQTIKRERFLHEALGDVVELNQDSKATGDAVRTQVVELSTSWYENQARKLLEDYGEFTRTPVSIEHNWNPLAVRRYCESVKATSGVEIDQKKLQEAVDKMLQELEERRTCCYGSMKEVRNFLEKEANQDSLMETPMMPVVEEEQHDPLVSLLKNPATDAEYIKFFESMFRVKKADVPAAVRKYRLGEGVTSSTMVPMKAYLPQGCLNVVTEQVLDRYVEAWNSQQALVGEPLKLDWNADPSDSGCVGFDLELF